VEMMGATVGIGVDQLKDDGAIRGREVMKRKNGTVSLPLDLVPPGYSRRRSRLQTTKKDLNSSPMYRRGRFGVGILGR
jgi:hypothetical protein